MFTMGRCRPCTEVHADRNHLPLMQKEQIYKANSAKDDGRLRSDESGLEL